MDRKRFLKQATLAGSALAAGAASAQDGATRVPMEVEIHPSWLTWVTAATGCLRALGLDVDNVDVAGHSGYAFHMCITNVAGVEGPTVLPLEDLANGCRMLGRGTLELQGANWREAVDAGADSDEAYQLARRELDLGRPSIMWGTGLPEFGVITGYEADEYLYRWSGDPDQELRVRYNDLSSPGGRYLLMFPTQTEFPRAEADRVALANALHFLHRRPELPHLRFGLEAYDVWIAALQGKRANGFGNNYCAQCFSNGKQYARDFVGRLAARNEHAAGPLDEAIIAYEDCADAMGIVAQTFPFPGPEEENIEDLVSIDQAAEALATARDAEMRAAGAMAEALLVEWPDE